MNRILYVLALLLIVISGIQARTKPMALGLQTIDSNRVPVSNVHSQGPQVDITANGTSNTISSTFKTLVGDAADANGDVYMVELIVNAKTRYVIDASPTVDGTTGSFLPANSGKAWRVRADNKIAIIANGTTFTRMNITRMQ